MLRVSLFPAVVERALPEREWMRSERREVAVLFADAVDFTRLSASLDAESVFNLINDLLGRLVACVHRYNGMVDKFTGDGLMAVFGAPVANENDPELAVRAALDMQKAAAEFEPTALAQLGAPLKIRIGIHSGPAVAGMIGTPQQAAYTVIGETVNLAARLEALARAGHILVSDRIYQQTRALFEFQSMGTIRVKGIDEPVAVYEVISDRSLPLATRGVAGVTPILLGRDAELERLRGLLAAFLEERRGRLVLIEGEAGLGKSRLVAEWLAGLSPDSATIWHGRGLPYSQGVGYGVFRSLLQSAIRSTGDSWEKRVSASFLPFLRQVLGLPLTPEEQTSLRYLEPQRVKQLTVLALREWVLSEARRRPLVLILDDFHWADDLSRDALQALVGVIDDAPVLVCVMSRPQPESPLDLGIAPAGETGAAPRSLSLQLQPLSPEHSRALLAHLVCLDDLPPPFVDTILTRAQGNPFYIEEFVRMLIEKEALALRDGQWHVVSLPALETFDVPTTLRGLMMARVDRLPEDLQNVLRDAAVIGLQFDAHLLEEMARQLHGMAGVLPALDRLVDLGLLVERPGAGGRVYAFRHILTQETIYSSLLRTQRPQLHLTVAECIERLYAADLERHVEVLALHYDRARVRDKAFFYAMRAGDRARARFANREAVEYYSRALQLSQHLGDYEVERWQATVWLGDVEQHIGEYEEAIACYRAALDEEWEGATPLSRAQVMLRMGQVWEKRGELEEAEGWLRQGLVQLDRLEKDEPALRAQICSELGWLNLRRGDLNSAQRWLEEGLALVAETDHYDVLSSILNRLGAVYYHRSEWGRATECVEQALALRERLGDIVGYARSLNNLGILKHSAGDIEGALSCYARAAELHEQIGEVEGQALARTNLGVLYTDLGDWEQAEKNLQQSFAIAQRIAHPYELAQAHMNLGRLYLLQERWQECAAHLDSAIPLYREAGAHAHLNLNDAYYLQGWLHLEQGEVEEAAEWARRSYELLCEVTGSTAGDSVEWGRYEQLMGRIAQARGDLEAARRHFDRGTAILQAGDSKLEAWRMAYWSGLLSLEMGDWERARDELTAARCWFEQLGARADLQRVERALSRLAHITTDLTGL